MYISVYYIHNTIINVVPSLLRVLWMNKLYLHLCE